jgi:hypothetical protein
LAKKHKLALTKEKATRRKLKKEWPQPGVVAHAFNPSTREAEAGGFLSSEVSLVYRVSSRTARAIERNHVSKNKQIKNLGAGKMAWRLRALCWACKKI